MREIIVTKEYFNKGTPLEVLQNKVDQRIVAGAIQSQIVAMQTYWIIETEWNESEHLYLSTHDGVKVE